MEGAPPVVLLSHRTWRTRFGADPHVVGRSVSLSEMPYTVIGVMPEGFRPPFAPDAELWRALGGSPSALCGPGCAGMGVLARLAGGVTLAQARAHGAALAARLAEAYPDTDRDAGLRISGLRGDLVRRSARPLWILLGAVGFVLLIACTNVANLLLARGLARRDELAVRVALGAERGRIAGLLLAESLVLAVLGGVAGVGLAAWGTDGVLALAPPQAVAELQGVGTSGRVLAFTIAVSMATGVLFGLLPALRLAPSGAAPPRALPKRTGARVDTWAVLAVAQLALAVVLVGGAGLLVRSFLALDSVDLGFSPERVLAAELALPEGRYPEEADRRAYVQALVNRLRDLPGVSAVGAASVLPLAPDDREVELRVEGAPPPVEAAHLEAGIRPVTEGYFEAVGLTLHEGRGFEATDRTSTERVVVVNETLARALFPDGGAEGRRIAWSDNAGAGWRTIVGVARDARHFGLREPPHPAVYVPYRQMAPGRMSLVVRVSGDPLAFAEDLRQAVSGLDPALAPAGIRPLRARVDEALAPDRFVAVLLSVFAVLALALAAVGVYGVTWHGVAWRTREVAVRLALGADAADVLWTVVRGALVLAAAGVGIGAAGTLAMDHVLSGFLFGVEATDVPTVAATAALLACVAVLAAWSPARRAGRADPMRGLRP